MLPEDRVAALRGLVEKRGQGRIIQVKGKGKVGALVNAANGAQASITNGLSTMRGALNQVIRAARELGKDDIVKAIQSRLSDIAQAEEALRDVLGKLDTPAAVGESVQLSSNQMAVLRSIFKSPPWSVCMVPGFYKTALALEKKGLVKFDLMTRKDGEPNGHRVLVTAKGREMLGESEDQLGVPKMDGEGPHGAGMGPRARGRRARKVLCKRAQ